MYGKIFASMYEGSLYGHWQSIVTLQQLIVICDQDGIIDMTPAAISGRTSIPLDIIDKGLEELSKPDPASRSDEEEGRRIVLIDPSRPWGWRIVNYAYYRDIVKAIDKREADRARIAGKRGVSQDVANSREVSQSVANSRTSEAEADSYADSNLNKEEEAAAFLIPECPKDMDVGSEHRAFCQWYGEKGKPPTSTGWRRWVLKAKERGTYARCKPRPPTEAEVRAERNRIALAQT